MPDSLAADLDAECSACLMGARRLAELFDRYGRDAVEALLRRDHRQPPRETFRTELLSKIPDGELRLGGLRRARRRGPAAAAHAADHADQDTPARQLVLDFTGTSPQAKGPINHCADYADGVFLAKWLAPILRNLADTPERMAAARRQRGRRAADRDALPAKGNAAHAGLPGADQRPHVRHPAAARACWPGCWPRRSTAGCPPTRRRSATPACTARDADGAPYLMREVLGGGSGGR